MLEAIGTWRCWSIILPSSYVLMCGRSVVHVHQVGFGIWARRWNNVATPTRAWTWWNLEQRHGDWYTADTRRTLQKLSVGLLHDHADKYNQLLDESPDELKEQKHTDNQRHELQPVDVRSLTNIGRSFVTNTMRSRRPWRIFRPYNSKRVVDGSPG